MKTLCAILCGLCALCGACSPTIEPRDVQGPTSKARYTDPIPGLPGWGAKSAATLLSRYGHIEDIPEDTTNWGISAGRARRLAENLSAQKENALLYRRLTTLRTDVPLTEGMADLEWGGVSEEWNALCQELGIEDLVG